MSEEGQSQEPTQSTAPKVDVAALEAKYQREQARAVDLEKKLERFSDIDPDKYRAVLEDYDNLRREKAEGDPQEMERLINEKKAELEERYSSHLTEKDGRISTLEKELKQLRVTDKLLSQAAAKFNDDALSLLKSQIEQEADLLEGEIVIKDKNGEVRVSPQDPRRPMSAEEYLNELASRYPSTVKSDFRGGSKPSGETRNGHSHGDITVEQYAAMTREEQLQLDPQTRGKLARQALGMKG